MRLGLNVEVDLSGKCTPEPRRDTMADIVSVLVDRPDHLGVLSRQSIREVEILSWDDAPWHHRLGEMAEGHGWDQVRVRTRDDALARARGTYIVGWGASVASSDALEKLRQAAAAEPSKLGALTANFDPLILWRRAAFSGEAQLRGLVQVDVYALAGGSGTDVHPSSAELRAAPRGRR